MNRYRVSGQLFVGFSYDVEALDSEAALDVPVGVAVVVGDDTGQHLCLTGAGYRSVRFHVHGCYPEGDEVEPLDQAKDGES